MVYSKVYGVFESLARFARPTFPLVPKLRLVTHARQALLGSSCPAALMSSLARKPERAKPSFAVAGSQAGAWEPE